MYQINTICVNSTSVRIYHSFIIGYICRSSSIKQCRSVPTYGRSNASDVITKLKISRTDGFTKISKLWGSEHKDWLTDGQKKQIMASFAKCRASDNQTNKTTVRRISGHIISKYRKYKESDEILSK